MKLIPEAIIEATWFRDKGRDPSLHFQHSPPYHHHLKAMTDINEIAKQFVNFYYTNFDNNATRGALIDLYVRGLLGSFKREGELTFYMAA